MFTMPVMTAVVGNNSDLVVEISRLYIPKGSVVADVTYGKGVFWKRLCESDYNLYKSDLSFTPSIDFCDLPYEDNFFDVLILDPPYMHGGEGIKDSINGCYRNKISGHESIIRLYTGGILEAARVLKKGGLVIVKSQDEMDGRQRFSHIELMTILELLGFKVIDLFVLVQTSIPTMREDYQKSASKNHSYAIIAKFSR